MKLDFRHVARFIGRVLAGRTVPATPLTITDPLAVYSYVMGHQTSRVDAFGLAHVLKLAQRSRENPHERQYRSPDELAMFARVEWVGPQILAMRAELRAGDTPEGRKAHFAKLTGEVLKRRVKATNAELRAMSRTARIDYQMELALILTHEAKMNQPPVPPPRRTPYLATTAGALTPQARAAGIGPT